MTHRLLRPHDEPAAELVNPEGACRVILVCEHASNAIPDSLNGLGLDPAARTSHAAWDIGARDLALCLSQRLDAPLVASRVSRLVYDCNRAPASPGAMPDQSERISVPGNRNLTGPDRQLRIDEVYLPFRHVLRNLLDSHAPIALVTVHSFTPIYFDVPRAVELGLLHDRDDRLAKAMLAAAPSATTLRTELNAPYSAADGVMHTLTDHALPRGLLNVMIEVRNDLLVMAGGPARVAGDLAAMLGQGLSALDPSWAASDRPGRTA
ncbi:N-formylglutamate amidohydrolase [Pseudoruegeria sp. SK021]|uniref:N-formylglutamate amidohydrolase n=1 Tax=Pseudoruegeria sp. SK021 TaxID=1933035 RepID=UPI000A2533BF|nr:N-formylglutamate amidohydrolase [Pseudoruegeria sp. SK021]OSP55861.1 N-formylglutamate amidohydrolase [Pseudoruegeria sp. SK021]